MNLFFQYQSWAGVFYGLMQAFAYGVWYAGSPFDHMHRYRCCSRLSRQLEVFDARNSTTLLAAMRSSSTSGIVLSSNLTNATEIDDNGNFPLLGHDGIRMDSNAFQGVWWMNGNAASEVLVTMADAFYPTEGTDLQRSMIRNPVLDVEGGTWSYENVVSGRMLFLSQCVQDIAPYFVIDESETRLLYQGGPLESNLMTYIDEDTYTKQIFNGEKVYTFRRIIDAHGMETANWSRWISATKSNYRIRKLLTYRRRETDETCHYE